MWSYIDDDVLVTFVENNLNTVEARDTETGNNNADYCQSEDIENINFGEIAMQSSLKETTEVADINNKVLRTDVSCVHYVLSNTYIEQRTGLVIKTKLWY